MGMDKYAFTLNVLYLLMLFMVDLYLPDKQTSINVIEQT